MLILFKELLEDGAIDHVTDNADVKVLFLRIISSLHCLPDVLLYQSQQLIEVLVKSDQYELKTLCFIFSAIFSLPFNDLE
jgi:hypothetical protein